MKIRFLAILAILAGLISPAYSAGTIPGMSLSQQFDTLGKPLAGCKLYTFAAGTTTPQSLYQDSGLTIPWPNPVTCDSAGRLPQLFAADGSIKIRLSSSAGVTQVSADGILVVGASSGGGGGSPVDATTILATGDLKTRYGTGVLSGFVRLNGRTIGSATSGATERANSDCQALFEYLWGADSNLSVSGGRGASANADWVANKTLNLPDGRGRVLAPLDDMGNSAAGRYSGATISGSATTLGATVANSITLITANLPPYTPVGSLTGNATVGVALNGASNAQINFTASQAIATGLNGTYGSGTLSNVVYPVNNNTLAFAGNAQGGTSTPFTTFMPALLVTNYMKL